MSQSPIAADDAALRSDVRRLGDLLGQTLVRQEGPELLALVEEVRKAVREGSGALSNNLFGANVTADSVDRMGEIIAIARGGLVLLDADRADKEGAMVGHHGGYRDFESQVGLLTTTLS